MKTPFSPLYVFLIVILFFISVQAGHAQSILTKRISVQASKQPIKNILEIISNKGDFFFSYHSGMIKKDSLISINAVNKSVKEILDIIFTTNYDYIETGEYLILRRKPISMVLKQETTDTKNYSLSGYVEDIITGTKLKYATVYEPIQLASALTNENGYFNLKLKSQKKLQTIMVSRIFYKDTTFSIEPKINRVITITLYPEDEYTTITTISPEDYSLPDSIKIETPSGEIATYIKTQSLKVQKNRIGRFLLSSKQVAQSMNLKKFFANKKFQLSLVPGVSTQGKLSSRITNNLSLNIIGGYTGGVKMAEVGGAFNIDNYNVHGVQIAGGLNLVGNELKGVQISGGHNSVLTNSEGIQISGISNYVRKTVKGVQIAGLYNQAGDTLKGVQISGLINVAHIQKGLQIGLINIADSSEGYSLGLINIIRKNGYKKKFIGTNEITPISFGMLSGTKKLYTNLYLGGSVQDNNNLIAAGFGIGKLFPVTKFIALNTDVSFSNYYAGSFRYSNAQTKLGLSLELTLFKKLTLYGGGAYSIFYSNQSQKVNGYRFPVYNNIKKVNSLSDKLKAWPGFTAGIRF